ncbi:MAG: NAD-dependent deacylase [candidate division NC10 bacterium]|nr:NAD-dependent deacylase [candidate division NC10 bacterium]
MQARSMAILTGAGISAESGVPTFRGPDGLWKTYRPEDLATPEAFAHDPRLVWEWYDWRRQLIARCQPNPGHYVLAEWERRFKDFLLITQNVDGLHRRAGSSRMVELHGNIWKVRCLREGAVMENYEAPLKEIPPHCPCGGLLRPEVVWFGEPLPVEALRQAYAAAERAELFFSIGTSAVVQPAASLPLVAKQCGAYVVEINRDPTPITPMVNESFQGAAGPILEELSQTLRRISS